MRPLSYLTIPIAVLVAACEGQPVAPERGVRPQFEATHGEFTTTFNFVDDPADCTANSRVGEVVLFTGQITYVERTTTTSSGNANVSWYFIYDPAVHVVGQTSGTVWMINATNTQPIFILLVHGNGLVNKINEHEFYTDR